MLGCICFVRWRNVPISNTIQITRFFVCIVYLWILMFYQPNISMNESDYSLVKFGTMIWSYFGYTFQRMSREPSEECLRRRHFKICSIQNYAEHSRKYLVKIIINFVKTKWSIRSLSIRKKHLDPLFMYLMFNNIIWHCPNSLANCWPYFKKNYSSKLDDLSACHVHIIFEWILRTVILTAYHCLAPESGSRCGAGVRVHVFAYWCMMLYSTMCRRQ